MSKPQEKNTNIGQFPPGNTIGSETRFKPGHKLSSKYKQEYCKEMVDYFLDPTIVFHTFAGFARKIGVLEDTITRWAEKYPHFKTAHAYCAGIQKDELLIGGLTKRFEPSLVKFLAINNHGMSDKVTQKLEGDNLIEVNINVVD